MVTEVALHRLKRLALEQVGDRAFRAVAMDDLLGGVACTSQCPRYVSEVAAFRQFLHRFAQLQEVIKLHNYKMFKSFKKTLIIFFFCK